MMKPGGELCWRAWGGVVALPALLLAALIAIYSVDLPCYDQWVAVAPLLEKWHAGTLRFDDVVALHNEHRLVIPRLIFLPLAALTHWNTRVEMGLTWLLLLGVAANWWRLLRATGWTADSGTHALFATMALLVFHTLQFENVLSGFQFHFILPIFFITAGLWVALAWSPRRSLAGVLALATAATFSGAQGLLAWPLLAPVLWLRCSRRARSRGGRVYVAVALVSVALYFRGYAPLAKHPGPHDAGQFTSYALTFLGAPFTDGRLFPPLAQAQTCGAVLVILFACAALQVWRRRHDAEIALRALPWLMAGALAIGAAVLTAWGRAGFGVEQAFETRYTTYAIVLPIALLPLGALFLWSENEVRSRDRWLAMSGAVALLALHITAQAVRLDMWSEHRDRRLVSKAILETRHLWRNPALGQVVSPEPETLAMQVPALQRLGYLRLEPNAPR
jgi:hypothetical protein